MDEEEAPKPPPPWYGIKPTVDPQLITLGQLLTNALRLTAESIRVAAATTSAVSFLVLQQESLLLNASTLALRTALNTINGLLDALLDSTGLYILPIPLPKLGAARYIPLGAPTRMSTELSGPNNTGGQNNIQFPSASVAPQASDNGGPDLQENPIWQQIINPSEFTPGGNAYVLKTISEALYDRRDVNRPVLTNETQWGYALMLAGASDITSIMNIGIYFSRLIRSLGNSNTVGPDSGLNGITPSNVTATLSGRGNFVVISWAPVPSVVALRSYDGSEIAIKKYCVIRAKGMRARTVQRTDELFTAGNGKTLTEGQTGTYDAVVLKVSEFDSVTTRYVDESDLDADATYFYFVAFSTEVIPAIPPVRDVNDNEVPEQSLTQDLGFSVLSTAAEFKKPPANQRRIASVSRLGTAPDWLRCAGFIGMVEPLNRFIDRVQETIRDQESRIANVSDVNSQYLEFLNRQVSKYVGIANDIANQIEGISRYFDPGQLQAGTHITFRNGSGAAPLLIADVATALDLQQDPNWPPFTVGDEFIVGLMALAVAPSQEPILAYIETVKSLFAGVRNETDAFLVGIESVVTNLAVAEERLFEILNTPPPTETTESVTFNLDMTPRPPGTGDARCDRAPTS